MDVAVFLHGSLCVCFCSGWWELQLSCQMEPHLVQLLPRGRGKLCHLVLRQHWRSWYSRPSCAGAPMKAFAGWMKFALLVLGICVTLAMSVVSVLCQRADALPEALQHSGTCWEIPFISRCQDRCVAYRLGCTDADTSVEYRLISGSSTLLRLMKYVLIPRHRCQIPVVYAFKWEFIYISVCPAVTAPCNLEKHAEECYSHNRKNINNSIICGFIANDGKKYYRKDFIWVPILSFKFEFRE